MTEYHVSDGADIGTGCRFGYNVVVEEGAHLGDGVVLGHNAVILSDAWLEDGVEVGHSSVLGKPPKGSATSARPPGPGGRLTLGAGTVVGASAVLHSGTTFGQGCYIGDLAAVREGCAFGDDTVLGRLVQVEYDSTIGKRARIQTASHVTGNCIIEDEVFFGPGVQTTNDRYMSMCKEKVHLGPTIRRGAAIGGGACVLAGVTIGEYAVVGLGAVVVTDVPSKRIFIGVPARDAGEVRGA